MFTGHLSGLGVLSLATEKSETAHLSPQVPDLGLIMQMRKALELTPTSATKNL